MSSVSITAPIIVTLCEGLFVRRVYLFVPQLRAVVAVSILLLGGYLGCFLAMVHTVLDAPDFFAESLPPSGFVTAGAVCIMLADIPVTVVLVRVLRRSRTGLKRTDSLFDIFLLYTASTGLMNCLLNALDIVLALAYPKTMIYTSFSVVLVKVYGISFLVTLNSRHTFASHGLNGEITSPFRSSLLRQFKATSGQRSRTHFVSLPHQLPFLHLDASRSSAVELVGMPSPESPGKRDADGYVRTPSLQVEECDE